jgi:hypothetical protein
LQQVGVVAQFGGGARVAEHAALHDVRARRERQRHGDELLDEQHSGAGLDDRADNRDQPADDHRGQSQGQLVDQDELGLRHQGLCEHHHLLLAAGQQAGLDIEALVQAREQLKSPGAALGRRLLGQGVRRHADVVVHRQAGQQPAALRDDGDPGGADLLWPPARQLRAVERHRAGTRPQHAADGQDERRLAGAVRPEESGHLPGGHGNRHVLDDRAAAALDGDVAQYQFAHAVFPARSGAPGWAAPSLTALARH